MKAFNKIEKIVVRASRYNAEEDDGEMFWLECVPMRGRNFSERRGDEIKGLQNVDIENDGNDFLKG